MTKFSWVFLVFGVIMLVPNANADLSGLNYLLMEGSGAMSVAGDGALVVSLNYWNKNSTDKGDTYFRPVKPNPAGDEVVRVTADSHGNISSMSKTLGKLWGATVDVRGNGIYSATYCQGLTSKASAGAQRACRTVTEKFCTFLKTTGQAKSLSALHDQLESCVKETTAVFTKPGHAEIFKELQDAETANIGRLEKTISTASQRPDIATFGEGESAVTKKWTSIRSNLLWFSGLVSMCEKFNPAAQTSPNTPSAVHFKVETPSVDQAK